MATEGMNERLRVAMTAKAMEIEALARLVSVDPKTVQRWLGGRVPHPRHRWRICDILGHSEQDLWPGVGLGASGAHHTSEIAAAYAHRADAPSQLWAGMLDRVRTNLDLLGYAMLFFPEQHPRLAGILGDKCAGGLRVRIALADPDSAEVMARDKLEGLGGTLPGRILSTVRRSLVREMFRLVWERERWPLARMGFAEWDRLTAVAFGETPAVDLPGGIRSICRDRVVQIGPAG